MALVDCYHGTTLARAKIILRDGFRISTRPRMWLGSGVYFFQDAPQLSRQWAEFVAGRSVGPASGDAQIPSVIHMQVESSEIIDLASGSYWSLLHELYTTRRASFNGLAQNGIDILCRPMTLEEKKLDLDHPIDHRLADIFIASLRALSGVSTKPSAIRAVFMEGRPIHPTSWFFDQSSIMVNVVDTSIIRSPRIVDI